MLSTKFQFIWESGFIGDFFKKSTSQKKKACGGHVVNGLGLNEHF